MGAIPQHQGGGEDAYAVGPAWQYPEFHTCFRRKSARCQRARSDDPRARGDLYNGSRLSRFRAALHTSRRRRIFCHPRQSEFRFTKDLFGAERPGARDHLRSNGGPVGILQSKALPPSSAPHSLQRSGDRENAYLSDQPFWSSTNDHLRTIQSQVASRVVFQMDQATSPYQEVLRHVRECRQGVNLGRRVGVRAGSYHQEAPQLGCLALHFVTGIFSHPFRKNPFKQGSFRYQAYPGG